MLKMALSVEQFWLDLVTYAVPQDVDVIALTGRGRKREHQM